MQNLRIQALTVLKNSNNPSISAANELGIPIIELVPDIQTSGIFNVLTDIEIDESIIESVKSQCEDIALQVQTSSKSSQLKIVPFMHQFLTYSINNIINAHDLTYTFHIPTNISVSEIE